MSGTAVDLAAVRDGPADGSGVASGRELLAFADVVMRGDAPAIESARADVERALGPRGVVDAAAVMAMFNVVDRVADATGIPIDEETRGFREGIGEELGMGHLRPEMRAR